MQDLMASLFKNLLGLIVSERVGKYLLLGRPALCIKVPSNLSIFSVTIVTFRYFLCRKLSFDLFLRKSV